MCVSEYVCVCVCECESGGCQLIAGCCVVCLSHTTSSPDPPQRAARVVQPTQRFTIQPASQAVKVRLVQEGQRCKELQVWT